MDGGVNGRVCFLVVKNGKIVHETYRRGWSESRTRPGWSTTKSMCSSLYGVATQQGWADPADRISARNSGTRRCNAQATFRHALTMTGTSSNINSPRFSYDTDGTNCLDSLSDFIEQNNPDGLSARDWKDQHWQQVLGMEHTSWGSASRLQCGYTVDTSCRDLARAAQLWVNEGAWAGHGQVMSREHAVDGRKWTYPQSGTEYGYTNWLHVSDPVDPEIANFDGMYAQCAFFSKRHEALVVSMGDGPASGGCHRVWQNARNAVVAKDMRNQTRAQTAAEAAAEDAAAAAADAAAALSWLPLLRNGTVALSARERAEYNAFLRGQGERPL